MLRPLLGREGIDRSASQVQTRVRQFGSRRQRTMGERPRGFVFYPQDYFGDTAVRLMPAELRMVWVEMLFLMHTSPRYGVLLKTCGEAYSPEELAGVMHIPEATVRQALEWIQR